MKRICLYLLFSGCTFCTTGNAYAQVDTLADVRLLSKKPLDIAASPVPVQELNKEALSKLNSVSVADAVKYLSGVVVKDYGGIGGLKTVSVRSLGANHTGLMYDGIIINDAQGGQVDFGRFSLDNIESIQLFSNQPPDIFLPARTYASASVVGLATSAATNDHGPKTNLNLKLKGGSFEFINPSLYYKARVNKHFSTAINGEFQSAKGDYSFVNYETGDGKKRRTNSDIQTYRLEYDAGWAFNDSNFMKFKTYYYNSDRGLPGAVILYRDYSGERLENENFFSQFTLKKNLSPKSRILFSSKYSFDYKYYLDPAYQNSAGKLENKFHQREIYLSGVYGYAITRKLSLSYGIDYFNNRLRRTDDFAQGFANPTRNSVLNNLALRWKFDRLEINGNLLHTFISDKVKYGPNAKDLGKLTPAISLSLQPFKNHPLRIRASYKNIFRAPTFDDLYYTNVGNSMLKPEYAQQYNFGITYAGKMQRTITRFLITTDAYYNDVKDKILAVPRQNLFQWSMLNIGKVKIKGVDVTAHLDFAKWRSIGISTNLSYSYQQAQDVSDPSSALYKTQLPYTPMHSGSINVAVSSNSLSLSYNILLSSYRYRLGEPTTENLVQGWATHDFSLGYTLKTAKSWGYKFIAEVNNIYNVQYEIIKYYPMPRFNYRLGIIASFNK